MMKATWRLVEGGIWQFHARGYAVFGTVMKDPNDSDMWRWAARVMDSCRDTFGGKPITGKAYNVDSAKRIVECLCVETETLFLNDVEFPEYNA